ncbi:hypothetical protein ACQJBY_024441 [Aegilops geniculata]
MDAVVAMDRLARRQQKLPPAGTKRKLPEPRTLPPLSSRFSSVNARHRETAEKFLADIASADEVIRELDEALAKQGDDMEQG